MICIFSAGAPYRIEAEASTVAAAVALCDSLERTGGDGFARAAYRNGRLVATSDGPIEREAPVPAYVVAVTRDHDAHLRGFAL